MPTCASAPRIFVVPIALACLAFAGCAESNQDASDASARVATGGSTREREPASDASLPPDAADKESMLDECADFDFGDEKTGYFSLLFPEEAMPVDDDAGMAEALSSCTATTDLANSSMHCAGYAMVAQTDGGATFTFEDGVIVRWEGSTLRPQNVDGARLFVSYRHSRISICPFCGSSVSESLAVTRTADGDQAYLLFGGPANALWALKVSSRSTERCTSAPHSGDCYVNVRRTYYDNILEFPDEVSIPYGKLTELSAPEGDFWLRWSTSGESGDYECADGPGFFYEDDVTLIRRDWALP